MSDRPSGRRAGCKRQRMLVERPACGAEGLLEIGESTRARRVGAARSGYLAERRSGSEDPLGERVNLRHLGGVEDHLSEVIGVLTSHLQRYAGSASNRDDAPLVDTERPAEVLAVGGHRLDVVRTRIDPLRRDALEACPDRIYEGGPRRRIPGRGRDRDRVDAIDLRAREVGIGPPDPPLLHDELLPICPVGSGSQV